MRSLALTWVKSSGRPSTMSLTCCLLRQSSMTRCAVRAVPIAYSLCFRMTYPRHSVHAVQHSGRKRLQDERVATLEFNELVSHQSTECCVICSVHQYTEHGSSQGKQTFSVIMQPVSSYYGVVRKYRCIFRNENETFLSNNPSPPRR